MPAPWCEAQHRRVAFSQRLVGRGQRRVSPAGQAQGEQQPQPAKMSEIMQFRTPLATLRKTVSQNPG